MEKVCALCGYALEYDDLDKGYCSLCGADCERPANAKMRGVTIMGKKKKE